MRGVSLARALLPCAVAMRVSKRWLGAVVVMGLTLLGTSPVVAQSEDDFDGDGVPDAVDVCPDDAPGELVDGEGCPACDCDFSPRDEEWESHTAYVRCVQREVKARRAAGTVTRRAARQFVKRAQQSTCGNPEMTRCCLFATEDALTGKCRILPWDKCDEASQSAAAVDDFDEGSCLPNPCTIE